MTTYYSDEGTTLIQADCYDELASISFAARFAVVTDPPYGIGWPGGTRRPQGMIVGDDKPFDPAPLLALRADAYVLFGANHYADKLPAATGWVVWDKREGMEPTQQGDAELAWTTLPGPVRYYRHRWHGGGSRLRENRASRPTLYTTHPNQKPLGLMIWLLERIDPSWLIVDPFAGSGTTLVAAKALGRRALGIELEDKWCELAASRLAQEVIPW